MTAAALYILTGLTLYGGAHHLYFGARHPDRYPHLQLGGLYLLAAGFALSSALTYQLAALETLLPTGKLDISFGILLWVGTVWHVAFRAGYKPLIALDLLTALWAIFLIRNMIEPTSLLYADVTPIKQTLLSGETQDLFFASISPWWTAVELAMLVSLLFGFYACYKQYQRGQHTLALVTVVGLSLLSLVTLFDHLVSVQVIRADYLAPFGFVLFLLPASLYPLVKAWHGEAPQDAPPVIYNLTYMPDQASFHTDVSQLRTPRQGRARKLADSESGMAAGPVRKAGLVEAGPVAGNARADNLKTMPATGLAAVVNRPSAVTTGRPQATTAPAPLVDPVVVGAITDNLIDIAVYATMALNRFKRGDADPQTLETLCKKVRTNAIKTRRLAAQLLPYDRPGIDKSSGNDD